MNRNAIPLATQVPCPERYYRADEGAASVDDCALCVSGGYCPSGSTAPLSCPRGYYCVTGETEGIYQVYLYSIHSEGENTNIHELISFSFFADIAQAAYRIAPTLSI